MRRILAGKSVHPSHCERKHCTFSYTSMQQNHHIAGLYSSTVSTIASDACEMLLLTAYMDFQIAIGCKIGAIGNGNRAQLRLNLFVSIISLQVVFIREHLPKRVYLHNNSCILTPYCCCFHVNRCHLSHYQRKPCTAPPRSMHKKHYTARTVIYGILVL